MPCPHGVSIPECFEFYNRGHMYEDEEQTKQIYTMFLGGFFDGTPISIALPGVRGMRREMPPEPPDPKAPEGSGGIFGEITESVSKYRFTFFK